MIIEQEGLALKEKVLLHSVIGGGMLLIATSLPCSLQPHKNLICGHTLQQNHKSSMSHLVILQHILFYQFQCHQKYFSRFNNLSLYAKQHNCAFQTDINTQSFFTRTKNFGWSWLFLKIPLFSAWNVLKLFLI